MQKEFIVGGRALTQNQYESLVLYVVGVTSKRAAYFLNKSSKTVETYWRDMRHLFDFDEKADFLLYLDEIGELQTCVDYYRDINELRRFE
jgi:DNA-binding CsgD family transcriptional regulator